jgi:uncharacterized protein with gpF-like domain
MAPPFQRGPVPKEALAYFDRKGLKPGFDYRDVWKQEHSVAFTIAKVMELDVLATMRDLIRGAIEEGRTFEEFQQAARLELDQSGWSDYHKTTPKKRRLRTIYDTNMRTARAAGQWQRIERTKRALPYLLYDNTTSLRKREEHEAWVGLVLHVDDPFWDYAMPPSGYGCKHRVRQVSKREAEGPLGGVSEAPPLELVPWENKRTGAVELIPRGVQPGFNYNPGNNRSAGAVFAADGDKFETAARGARSISAARQTVMRNRAERKVDARREDLIQEVEDMVVPT